MLKFVFIFLFILVYLRKLINQVWKITKINRLIVLYNSFIKATTENEKRKHFEQIVMKRPLSNELIGGFYDSSPTYTDSINSSKIRDTFFRLLESRDYCFHNLKKYFNPKYAIKDIIFLPASVIEFMFTRNLSRPKAVFLSVLGWIATILISTYSKELREIINNLFEVFN